MHNTIDTGYPAPWEVRDAGQILAIAETGKMPHAFVSNRSPDARELSPKDRTAADFIVRAAATLPALESLIRDALAYEAEAFEQDTDVNGADLVQWFADWRRRAKAAVAGDPPKATERADHWADDPEFGADDWRMDVINGDTRLGYAEWVAHNRESSTADA